MGKVLNFINKSINKIGKGAVKATDNFTEWITSSDRRRLSGETWLEESQYADLRQKQPKATGSKKSDPTFTIESSQAPYSAYPDKIRPAALTVPLEWSNANDISPALDGDAGKLPYSLFNRFALYNYRGFWGGVEGSLAEFYTDANNKYSEKYKKLSNGENSNNITEQKLIEYYSNNFPRILYSPTDFLYNKYFQQIPPNYLITLRRFAVPCEDNIFNVESKSVSIATATTYFGEPTGNTLEEILKFSSIGIKYKEQTAEMQNLSGGSSTKGPGFLDKKGGKAGIISSMAATMAGVSAADIYRKEAFGNGRDTVGAKYGQFVFGPVNVIDRTYTRDRGINFSNEFSLNFNYELKSWFMVNPKIAMMDIISNMLVMTTNSGDFWGGGWRYSGGSPSASPITDLYGDSSLLRSGDFIGYAKSLVQDVVHGGPNGQPKGITGLFGNGEGGFDLKSIVKGISDVLQSLLTQKIGNFLDTMSGGQQQSGADIPKAIISGEPTGSWHVTVGNPLNPIAIMGNMICENNEFTLGGGLGYDDFPMEFTVKTSLKHGKPRDRSDIESMFNGGAGRIYAAPADDDILNIEGKEMQEYGVLTKQKGWNIGDVKIGSKEETLSRDHVSHIIALALDV